MIDLPQPEVILTHESDLDGLVAGLLLQRLAKQLFGMEVPLEAYHYHQWRQHEPREQAAWVADLAFEARLDRLQWLIIDHHPTDRTPKNAQLIHDYNKSASLLTYELCCQHGLGSPALERLAHLSNVSDLFLKDDPEFETALDYANLVKNYQFWNLHALIQGVPEKLLDHPLLEVTATKRRVEDPIGFEWSRHHIVPINQHVGLVESVVGNVNQIIHRLLESKVTSYNVLMTIFRKGNGPYVVSLRSQNGEAIQVAEQLQGGGHANACGACLPRSVQNYNDAIDYLTKVLNPKTATPLNSLENLLDSLPR